MFGVWRGWWSCALLALVACSSVGDSEARQKGCETACKFRLECRFDSPAGVPACAMGCPDRIAEATDDCRAAYEALGRCVSEVSGVGCPGFLAGFCGDEMNWVRASCNGEMLDGGVTDGEVPTDADLADSGPPSDAGNPGDGGEVDMGVCVPETCESMGAECGTIESTCGGAPLECPACTGGLTCSGNSCVAECVPDQSATGSASMAASTGAGTNAWSTPGAALVTADGASATVNLRSGEASQDLTLTDWGFALPAGAIVEGVRVSVVHSASGNTADDAIQLVAGGSTLGAPKTVGGNWPATPTNQGYGGATDTWGASITRAQVNASDFGVAVRARHSGGGPSNTSVEHVTMTVFFSVSCP